MKNHQVLCFLFLMCISIGSLSAQQTWQNYLEGSAKMVGSVIAESPDSGLVITSTTFSSPQQIILNKLSKEGNLDWRSVWRQTAGTGYIGIGDMVTLGDSGYVMLGGASDDYSFSSPLNALLIRFDENGDTLWTTTFGNTNENFMRRLSVCNNGDLLVTGETLSFGDFRAWLIRVGPDGQLKWGNVYSLAGDCSGIKAIETSTGNIVMIGRSASGVNATGQIWKLDAIGNVIWGRTYGDSRTSLTDLIETPGGNYLFCGTKKGFSNSYEVAVSEFSPNGLLNWHRSFFSQGSKSIEGLAIQPGDSGSHYVAHQARGWGPVEFGNIGIVHFDDQGNLLESRMYDPDFGGFPRSHIGEFIRGIDGSFYISGSYCGVTDCPIFAMKADPQLWLGCSDSQGNPQMSGVAPQIGNSPMFTVQSFAPSYSYPIMRDTFTSNIYSACTPVGLEKATAIRAELSIWPNPGHGPFHFETSYLGLGNLEVNIFDVQGKLVDTCELMDGRGKYDPQIGNGLYLAILMEEGLPIAQSRLVIFE